MIEKFVGPRGLTGYIRIKSDRDEIVEVQESSAAEPSVWIRVNDESAHLRLDEAKALLVALVEATT